MAPKNEAAANELKSFISSLLAAKLDEIKNNLQMKLQSHEESIGGKLRKLDGQPEEEKKKDLKAKPGKK